MVVCKRIITVRVGNNDKSKEYLINKFVTLREVIDSLGEYDIVNIVNRHIETIERERAKHALMSDIRQIADDAASRFPLDNE